MEALNLCIGQVLPSSGFKFHWRTKDTGITHLCFADDLLLFCHGDTPSVATLVKALENFYLLTGLTPNTDKSLCFLSNVPPNTKSEILHLTRFSLGSLPAKFLGVPLIASKLSALDCKPLLDRILSKVSSWTSKLLSYAGRLQLIRSVLFSIQSYWASIFILPAKVLHEITSILTRFLWKGSSLHLHGSKVAWKKVCLPFDEGGLNLKLLKDWNLAAILLQLWHIINPSSTSFWAKWLRDTVIKDKSFWALPPPADCSWIWRKVLNLRAVALQYISYSVGNGRSINLWFDPWYKGKPIASSSQDLLVLNSGLGSSAKVADILGNSDSPGWCLPPSNHHSVLQFRLEFDYSTSYDLTKSDSLSWASVGLTSVGPVSISSIWASIRHRGLPVVWSQFLWHKLHIPRFSFISWLLFHKAIQTKDRLIQYGLSVDPSCVLCNCSSETIAHLFFSCPFSYKVLFSVLRLYGWRGACRDWGSVLVGLSTPFGSKRSKLIGYLAFNAVVYYLWKERNSRLHARGSSTSSCLVRQVKHIVHSKWLSSIKPRHFNC